MAESLAPIDQLRLATPAHFAAFPFDKPYDIQIDLMRHLYDAIESRSLAIIESPTGTGKTLSLLTAALTWLHDDKDRSRKGQLAEMKRSLTQVSAATEPDWVIEQSIARQKRLLDQEEEEFTERLVNARKREEIVRRKEKGHVIKKARGEFVDPNHQNKGENEDRFLPEDGSTELDDNDDLLENMSHVVREQIKQLKKANHAKVSSSSSRRPGDPEVEDPICTKIYFASRTHTQLTQAISELRRVKLPPAPPSVISQPSSDSRPSLPSKRPQDELEVEIETDRPQTRAVPLGSRKNLCINDDLIASLRRDKDKDRNKLHSKGSGKENDPSGDRAKGAGGIGDLDEACRELNNRPKESRCPFLPPMDEESRLLDFRDHTLSRPRDIEDLVTLGRELKTCPYYGSRKAVNRAEIVTLPYNLLLQKTAREALGIDLKDQIVIVDEAHNLIDTVLSIHSHTLSSSVLQLSLAQLKAYYERFKNRLSPKHALHLKRLVLFISALSDYCRSFAASPPSTSSSTSTGGSKMGTIENNNGNTAMMTVGELVSRLGAKVDGLNLLEVVQYLRESKLARKITGYCDYVLLQQLTGSAAPVPQQTAKERRASSPPLHAVEAFLLILVDPNNYGRIFVEKKTASSTLAPSTAFAPRKANASTAKDSQSPLPTIVTLKYQLLNPEEAFRDVVQDARAVILAGGTMTPMSDFSSQLFSYLPTERLKTFSCGHVIPQKNLQTLVLTQGPRKTDLLWKFDKQGNKEMTEELGQMLLNIASIVPNGLVVFFPSYSFLDQAKKVWETSGLLQKRLSMRKKIFFEPRDGSEVESLLREYSEAARGLTSSSEAQQPGGTTPRGALLFAVVGGKVSEGLNFADELARAVIVIGLPFANLGSRELQERMRFVRERALVPIKSDAKGAELRRPTGGSGKDAGTELYENMCMKAVNQSIGRAIRHQSDWASLILIDQRYSTPRIQSKLPQWISGDITVAKNWGDGLKELGAFYRGRKVLG